MNSSVRIILATLFFTSAFVVSVPALFSGYLAERDGYYQCDSQRWPEGGVPYEGAYAGHHASLFPAGIVCDWNMLDGSVSSTVIYDEAATLSTLGGASFAIMAAAVLVLSSREASTG